MTYRHLLAALIFLAPSLATSAEPAPEPADSSGMNAYFKASLFSEDFAAFPVARVDSEVIPLQELVDALAGAHQQHTKETKVAKQDFAPVLDRLIAVRLCVVEARDMELDKLEGVKKSIEDYRRTAELEAVQRHAMKDAKANPAEVKARFEAAAREWKLDSLLFERQDDAKKAVAELVGGKSFAEVAKQVLAEKKASGGQEAGYVRLGKMLPQVAAAVQPLKVGGVTPPVKVEKGFAVARVADVRVGSDPAARAEAERDAFRNAQQLALKKYYDGMVKKSVKTIDTVLGALDFEAAKPGMKALAKDKRVVVKVQGAKPITVAEITAELEGSFYHGQESAIKEKKVNREVPKVVDALISRRLVPLEANRLGIPQSAEFKRKLSEYTNSALFGAFLQRTILPDAKVTDEEVKKYYDEHRSQYALSAFYRLEGLAFSDPKAAQGAVEKLRAGTDFKWLHGNAPGQIPPGLAKLQFTEAPLLASALPKDLATQLAASKAGEYKFVAHEGEGYAIHVIEVIPPSVKPLESVKPVISGQLQGEKLNKLIADYAAKLRQAHDVKVYLTKVGA